MYLVSYAYLKDYGYGDNGKGIMFKGLKMGERDEDERGGWEGGRKKRRANCFSYCEIHIFVRLYFLSLKIGIE